MRATVQHPTPEEFPVLLFRSPKIGRLLGVDIFLHWTMWLLPVFILARGLMLYSLQESMLQFALVFGVYASLYFRGLGHILAARRVRLRLRDMTLYPIGDSFRLAEMSDRPWKEIRVAAAGPLIHGLIAGIIAGSFVLLDLPLTPRLEQPEPYVETFFNRLFWLNVLLAVFQLLPAFPMDGGRIFRGALALSAGRLRATEVSAMLGSLIALLLLIPGMIWLSLVWWLILLGIVVHVASQQELLTVRYFDSLREPGTSLPARSPVQAAIEQLFDEPLRPSEADFTGFVWNPRNRLWIVWQNGEPISANALVGE